jgi:hypothetical protein
MINWNKLIDKNANAVEDFALGFRSANQFQQDFSGNPNPARCVVRNYGATYGRRLARKALRRRGIIS